jgi:DNA-binding transcriptional LysR family regulator
VEPGATVPLIAYRAPSISRQMAMDALEREGRTWRITCSTRDVNGVLAAVRAGMGVAVLPQALIPTDLVKVTSRLGLPELDEVDYVLMDNPAGPRASIEALTSAIMSRGVTRAS